MAVEDKMSATQPGKREGRDLALFDRIAAEYCNKPMLYRFAKFGSLGVLSFILSMGVTCVLHEIFHYREEIAFAIALAVVLTFSFLVCRHFVFPANSGKSARQFGMFALTSVCFRGVEFVSVVIMLNLLRVPYWLAIPLVQGSSFLLKFIFLGRVVFPPAPGNKP